ncbi:MAG TPA: TraC family protein [Candidatus Saccharimonadales bacterium]|nr:TraC family protein [Candidatus Saccharimonadales bacterium]
MSLFRKSNNKQSNRRQINIKEVKDGVLVLSNTQYRSIIETSSINFELKSEEEQDVLIDSFQNFLNSLSCSIQILVRVREIDVDRYLEDIATKQDKETEPIYKQQMKNYGEFIQNLISGNKILSRRFYIVIPYSAKEKVDFKLMKEQLLLNQDIVMKGIEKLGMKARALSSLEILDLFYSFYNPKHAKTQPITKETMRLLLNQSHEFITI